MQATGGNGGVAHRLGVAEEEWGEEDGLYEGGGGDWGGGRGRREGDGEGRWWIGVVRVVVVGPGGG